ncbi:MAG: hypothetical protein JXR77_18825 [Lentisphaeria bacterium]|nr:hypothetical protein [Lentisphaeria bacterium]
MKPAFAILFSAVLALAADYVWVEAENGTEKVEHSNDWYDPVDRETSLSGHDWWHSFDEPTMESGYVVCPFRVPAAGLYRLWIRLNTQSTGYLYALDGAEAVALPWKQWQEEDRAHRETLDHERRVFDETYVSHDGSNRHKLVWVKGPEVELGAGEHRLRLAVQPGKDKKGFAAVDCFVLAGEGFLFRPRLHTKPDERVETVPELDPANAWAFPKMRDRFSESPIDLRHLNERVAGEHGFIRLSADGNSLVRGDGEPIRFWSGSDYAWRIPFSDRNLTVSPTERESLAHHARWAAKRGVNMVRFHGHLPPKRERNGPPVSRQDINETDLHGAWMMVAAFKQEGIYSTLSPYWGSHTDNEASWELGFEGGSLTGLVFFYEPVQAMYREWLRRLYTEPNPYTGIPLKDDPAVAVIQLQNEDSLLFYTESQIKGPPREQLLRLFGDFLKKKYGSLETAFARYTTYESAWDLRGEDNPAKGTAGLLQMWFHTKDAKDRAGRWNEPTRNRLTDQLEFHTELMRTFNAETERYLREELGCRQLINAGNWKSVDPVLCDDAERYSYTANQIIGRNAYYSALHAGINTGWQILAQQTYTNWSALKRPHFWPMNVKQPAGHPLMIFESLWVPPNLYAAEGPLLVAAQLSLTGVDSFYWFASGGEEWGAFDGKWAYNTPMQMGLFPAAALAFRKGYIAEAEEPVVYEERSLEDIWEQKMPLIAESPVYDPNRDKGDMPVDSAVSTPVDPLAFCVGPVQVRYGGNAANNRVSPKLEALVDTGKKVLTSVTGQIRTDYGRGLYTVNAPKCQGAAGFLAEVPEIALGDVTLRSRNAYGSLVVVPLDDRPLAESRRVLVQSGTVARPSGWTVRRRSVEAGGNLHDGLQILRKGDLPVLVENTAAEVTITNPVLRRALALDVNGLPTDRKVTVERRGEGLRVVLPPDALYTVLTGEETP